MNGGTPETIAQLAIKHFEQPNLYPTEQVSAMINKIFDETSPEQWSSILKEAKQHSGKITIRSDNDGCGVPNKIDFSFHPLFSARPLGTDFSVALEGRVRPCAR